MILNASIIYFMAILYITKNVFSNDQVDEEHLSLYPYCGRLFGYGSNGAKAKSRVVNSEDSDEHELYPWVVYVEQKYLHKNNKHVFSYCSGTVIAYKHVVTAGHCICTTWMYGDVDAHEDSLCRPTSTSLPRNQIMEGKNDIRVHGGSKDMTRLLKSPPFKVIKALVFDNIQDAKIDHFEGKTDVGILITDRHLFDREYMNAKLGPNDKIPILPICLAKKDYDFDGQVVHGVGWGTIYSEAEKNSLRSMRGLRDPFYSSCMTNELGEEKWRFKACNMKQIEDLNWSCEKNELPRDVKKNRYRCRKYFENAKEIFEKSDKSYIKFLEEVHKIIINEKKASTGEIDPRKKLVCYNEEYFHFHGWCEVKGYPTAIGAWGFCSPSCSQYLLKDGDSQESEPRLYQDIKWKADNGHRSWCRYSKAWNPDFMVCIKSILPQADVGLFEITDQSDELNFLNFQKEYGPEGSLPDFQTSYISICRGDSGSGNWITVDEDHAKNWKNDKLNFDMKMSQRVLVTITTFQKLVTRDRNFDFNKLPFIGFVCGSDVTLDDGTRLVSAQYGTKTTSERILTFLKYHAEISEVST